MGALVGMSDKSGWHLGALVGMSNRSGWRSDALKMVSNGASFCSDAPKMVSNEASFCSDTPSVHFFDGFGGLAAADGSHSEGTDRPAAGDGKEEMKDGVLLRP